MIHIIVRETLDWSDEALVESRLHAHFRQKYDMWNATFRMPYRIFRARLKAIAEQNLAAVSESTVHPDGVKALEAIPREAVVVPVDDDDWFAPDLARHLEPAFQPGVSGVYWLRNIVEAWPGRLPQLRRFLPPRSAHTLGAHGRYQDAICSTNTYAIRNEQGFADLVRAHGHAEVRFPELGDAVRFIDKPLSVQNRTIASQTALAYRHPTITRRQLLGIYYAYRNLYRRVRYDPCMTWAKPYVEAIEALTDELRPR